MRSFPLVLILFAAPYAAMESGALWTMFTGEPNQTPPLVDFRSDVPSTQSALGRGLHGGPLTRSPDGSLAVDAQSGVVHFTFEEIPSGCVMFHLSAVGRAPVSAALEDLVTGEIVPIRPRFSIRHRDADLTPLLRGRERVRLTVSSSRPDLGGSFTLFEFVVRNAPAVERFPRLDIFLAALTILLILGFYIDGSSTRTPAVMAAFSAACALFAVSARFPAGLLDRSWFWIIGVALACLVDRWAPATRRLKHAPLWPLLVLGFCLRWPALVSGWGQPLEGDAGGYLGLVRDFTFPQDPFSFGKREPLYIWVQWLAGQFWGMNEFPFRLVTVILSIGCVALGYFLCRRLSGSGPAAFLAGAHLACSEATVWNSTRGERSELFLFLILAFLILALRFRDGARWAAIKGALAGLVSLTWIVGAFSCSLAYLFLSVRSRSMRTLRSAAIFFGVMGAVVSPHLISEWYHNGDPLWALNSATNFYRNARLTGVPDAGGERRSMASFVIGETGWKDSVYRLFLGYFDLFLSPTTFYHRTFAGFGAKVNQVLFVFLLLGVSAFFLEKRYDVFLLLFATLNVMPSFLDTIYDSRLLLQAAPFFALFIAMGLARAWAQRPRWRRS